MSGAFCCLNRRFADFLCPFKRWLFDWSEFYLWGETAQRRTCWHFRFQATTAHT